MAAPVNRTVRLVGTLSRLVTLPVPETSPNLGLGMDFNEPLPIFVLFNGRVSALVAAL
jgi:hypothetical protein